MREIKKTVELEGRKFVIHKLPAAESYGILADILTKAMPINLIGSALESFLPAGLLAQAAGKQSMTRAELQDLQMTILRAASEVLPAGETPVLDSQGFFQVEDLEYNMALFGALIAETMKWQYADFFTDALRKIGFELEDPEGLKTQLSATFWHAPETAASISSPP